MIGELLKIAGQCDGVRCDMAMLVLPESLSEPGASVSALLAEGDPQCVERVPDFCFMAEVYWDLEWTLQQQGFDYTYDKRLYDRLREGHARPVREHFCAGLGLPEQDGPLSWRTTTSLGRRRRSRPECMRPRRSSRFCPPVCGSSTRVSSRGGRNASRRICCPRPVRASGPETPAILRPAVAPCSASRSCTEASGSCCRVCRPPGKATGLGIPSPSPGRDPAVNGC